ncbi:hypothetical protein HQ545_08085 [Candidatus Woesearchaeota archaeon]|nr:hypothetical protein [Candidatus Woesearchaeota archaeon]
MFSAKSEDRIYIAGRITDPKSRSYTCRECDDPVSYVKSTTRSFNIHVSEHFRHMPGSQESHPERRPTWQRGDIVNCMIKNIENYDQFGFENVLDFDPEVRYTDQSIDFVADLVIRELTFNKPRDTAVFIESDSFNSNELKKNIDYLSSNNIASMVVLSAHGTKNKNGDYLKPEYRKHTSQTIANLGGNETELYDIQGRNVYFDHDKQTFDVLKFRKYTEFYEKSREFNKNFTKAPGHQTFKRKKIPIVETRTSNFGIQRVKRGDLLLARPITFFDYLFKIEERTDNEEQRKLNDEISERLSIMISGIDKEYLLELSRKHGKEKLGNFYVDE